MSGTVCDDSETVIIGQLINRLDQTSPATANLKLFYICTLLAFMLADGKVRKVLFFFSNFFLVFHKFCSYYTRNGRFGFFFFPFFHLCKKQRKLRLHRIMLVSFIFICDAHFFL